MYEWNEIKRKANLANTGLISPDRSLRLGGGLVIPDTRKDYGEPRFLAFGPIDDVSIASRFPCGAGASRYQSAQSQSKRVKRYG